MSCKTRFARLSAVVLAVCISACIEAPPIADMHAAMAAPTLEKSPKESVTTPILIDDNRIFVAITLIEPDGSAHQTLAFVNMGGGAFVLTNKLYRDLGVGHGRAVRMQLGDAEFDIAASAVQPEEQSNSFVIDINPFGKRKTSAEIANGKGGQMAQFAAPLVVEAQLPPGLLQKFMVAFDYGAKTMTIARPGALMPEGITVPIRINPRTGFATVDLTIDGKIYMAVIDNGGSFSVVRPGLGDAWLDAHPEWLRSEGGVGESNVVMDGDYDVDVPVMKVPLPHLGPLKMTELGIAESGSGSTFARLVGHFFWDYYSEKAGEPVDVWLGGNVLKSFRLTLDFPSHASYWLQEQPIDTHDLDSVGITLARENAATTVAGIAKKNGRTTVEGVEPGDRLLRIDGLSTASMTRGRLLAALHGTPGEKHRLTIERDNKTIEVDVVVTAF